MARARARRVARFRGLHAGVAAALMSVSDANGACGFESLPPGVFRVSVTTTNVPVVVTATTADDRDRQPRRGSRLRLDRFWFQNGRELPFTGVDAEHLMVAALLFLGLAGLVLADGRKRERRFDLAHNRIEN